MSVMPSKYPEEQTGEVKEKKPRGVKAEEFEQFKNDVAGMFDKIMVRLNTPTLAPSAESVPNEGGPDKNRVQVPPAWKELVETILGPEFDCEYELPPDGGQKFTILVPKDKSNASKDYLAMYKTDRRTKELGNTGARGVKEWCLKVRQNLLRSEVKLVQYP